MQRSTRRILLQLKRTQSTGSKVSFDCSTSKAFNASKRIATIVEKQQLNDLLIKSVVSTLVNKLNDVELPVVDRSQLLMCGIGQDPDDT
jgi:hypothetical protein